MVARRVGGVDATTLPDLLDRLLATDPSRPLVTFYDDATGERVELSATSFDNWVAKTANLLQDELGAEPGEQIALLLPTHWQSAVWVWAAAACGLVITHDHTLGRDAAVVVCGPETLETAAAVDARDVVALSLRPLGGACTEPLPAGVLDYAVEVPGQADVFVAAVHPNAGDPVVRTAGRTISHGDLVTTARAAADSQGLRAAARLATDLNPADPDELSSGVLAALVAEASVVLVRNPDPTAHARRNAQERVTTSVWSRG